MPAILVVVELAGTRPHPGSLEVLGQARRLGTRLGATVYAVTACEREPDDELIDALSRGGADKVLLGVSPDHATPMRWGTHGRAVMAACGLMPPVLVLLAETAGGRDVAARVAARLGACCLGGAWVEEREGELALWEGSGEQARHLVGEIDFTVVATVPPGRYAEAEGDEEAEAELLDLVPEGEPDFEEIAVESAPHAVVHGSGPAAAELAEALGGVVAEAAPKMCAAGLVVSLGPDPGTVVAPIRVTLGPGADAAGARAEGPGARYALEGNAGVLARSLAAALRGGGRP